MKNCMKKNCMKWLVGVLICLGPLLVNAAKVGVLNLKAIGVTTETAEAVAGLLASDLAGYGLEVLNPDAMAAATGEELKCYERNCAVEAGLKAKVEQVIFGSVSRLGEKYMVQVSVVSVSTREVIWSGSLAAKSAEDLDTVVKRIAKAIAEAEKVEAGTEIGTITEQERTQEAKRRESFYATGGNFSFGFPLAGYGGATSLMGLGWIHWYETPRFVVAVNWDYRWSIGSSASNAAPSEPMVSDYGADISFLYMFSKTDISPYIGAGLGPRLLLLSAAGGRAAGNFGMAFNGSGGLVLFRTYDFHLIAETRHILNLADLGTQFPAPHYGFNFSIGVVYRPRHRGGCGGCMGGGGGCM